ncbi:MAG: ATP-binding protein, partial [Prevotella sp.]|nr:ATP-binding protein [Prevotella sp.]
DNIVEYERSSGAKSLHIYESGINMPLRPFDLSNGMFRVFCVLLYMLYSSTLSEARCLVIDDMGEGLDYMRSTKLGKIMYEYCERNHIQLIATSNDCFLMDAVDLQYWNILQREGNRVYSINASNSPVLFEKFQRTGLSNFDILSSNFLANNSSDE